MIFYCKYFLKSFVFSDLLLLYMTVVKSIKHYNVLVFCAVFVKVSSCCSIHVKIVKDSSMCQIVKITGIANKTVINYDINIFALFYSCWCWLKCIEIRFFFYSTILDDKVNKKLGRNVKKVCKIF